MTRTIAVVVASSQERVRHRRRRQAQGRARQMKIFQGLDAARGALSQTAVTIGNFDGVHLGHRALFDRLRELAGDDAPLTAVTFSPHPVRYFRGPDTPPFQIASLRQKTALIEAAGADALVILAFDEALAGLVPEDFIETVLVEGLDCRQVLVGYDFSFGKGRAGGINNLDEAGAKHGFHAESLGPVLQEGSPISSSRIRSCLQAGLVEEAEALLGHPFALDGVVVHGEARGRRLGFPTANIEAAEQLLPARGVYICTLQRRDTGERHPAIANIGSRPTFHDAKAPVVVEAFLLEPELPVDLDLYEVEVELELHRFIREERSFPSPDALIAQITEDVSEARAYHGVEA